MAEHEIMAQEVTLVPLPESPPGEIADKFHFECHFCGKPVVLTVGLNNLHHQLQEREFYCNFCLRQRFHTKHARHVLLFTMRAIPGYYYYSFYRAQFGSQKMYFSEIRDYLDSHAEVGLLNPVFFYDPETFIWFVDFTRVGRKRGQIRIEEVQKTVANLLVCFNLPIHLTNVRMYEVASRFRDAIDDFYEHRTRPEGRKLLVPSLSGCGVYENQQHFTMEDTRNFSLRDFVRVDD